MPIYIAEVFRTGPKRKLRAELATALLTMPAKERTNYTIVGNGIVCLRCYTDSEDAALAAAAGIRDGGSEELLILDGWPHDVSDWAQAKLSMPDGRHLDIRLPLEAAA